MRKPLVAASFALNVIIIAFFAGASLGSPPASAQETPLRLSGTCSSGDFVVSRAGQLECVSLPSCGSGEFLTVQNGRLTCIGADNSTWGVEGLLPRCSTDQIVVSEGFGRWRCADPS